MSVTHKFKNRLVHKLSKNDCTDMRLLNHIKNYTVQMAIIDACVYDNIPIRAGVAMWERWLIDIKKKWKSIKERYEPIQDPAFRFYLSIRALYEYIQGTEKYCFKTRRFNFISELYLTGHCNCMCGTGLLFVLADYLGYRGQIGVMYIVGHVFLLIPNHNDFYRLETTITYFANTQDNVMANEYTIERLDNKFGSKLNGYTTQSTVFAALYALNSMSVRNEIYQPFMTMISSLFPFIGRIHSLVAKKDLLGFKEQLGRELARIKHSVDMLTLYIRYLISSFLYFDEDNLTFPIDNVRVYMQDMLLQLFLSIAGYYEDMALNILYNLFFKKNNKFNKAPPKMKFAQKYTKHGILYKVLPDEWNELIDTWDLYDGNIEELLWYKDKYIKLF